MSFTVKEDSPTFLYANTIQEICQHDLFDRYQFNYFQYLRCYHDGSFSLLSNRADWNHHAFQYANDHDHPIIMSCADADIIQPHCFQFVWNNHIPDSILRLAQSSFDITNGITFVERHRDYYDMIAFAAPSTNKRVYDIYLNRNEELQQFIIRFRNQYGELIEHADSQRIEIPEIHQDANKDILVRNAGNTTSHITKRELDCLLLLKQGATQKVIARELNIGGRSVETYFNRLKIRLNCRTKQELLNLI